MIPERLLGEMNIYVKAHGVLMSLAFVVVMPFGVLLIRVIKPERRVWIHAFCQMVGWLLMVAGLATGGRIAKIQHRFGNNTHTILGSIIVILLLLQPFVGFIHHSRFKATQKAGVWANIHRYNGRVMILLGIIDGGLGLKLANNTIDGTIAYGVIAGAVGLLYYVGMFVYEEKQEESFYTDMFPGT